MIRKLLRIMTANLTDSLARSGKIFHPQAYYVSETLTICSIAISCLRSVLDEGIVCHLNVERALVIRGINLVEYR